MIAFMLGTRLGQTITLALAISLAVGLSWWAFSSHYTGVGYEKCQGEHAAALAKANADQAAKNAENDRTSAEIGNQAADDAADVAKKADAGEAGAKEIVDDVYSKPAQTAPVALGSCVHPVDQRVQDAIDAAVRRANSPRGEVQTARGP